MRARPKVTPKGDHWVAVLVKDGVVLHLHADEARELHGELGRALGGFDTIKSEDARPMNDADAYFAELELVRGEVIAAVETEEQRTVLRSARICHRDAKHHAACAAHMHDAIEAFGWEEVREAVRWGWERIAAGQREKRHHVALFRAEGSFQVLYDSYSRAKQAQGEQQRAAEAAEAQRAREAAEEAAAMEFTPEKIAALTAPLKKSMGVSS